MGKIVLHTPMHSCDAPMYLLDKTATTTEFEANDIILVKSVVGDDNRDGTNFYIKGISDKQFCLENVNTLKKLIQDNKTEDKPFSIVQSGNHNAMAVGSGNQASIGGKEGGWAISGWWITLIGTLVGIAGLVLAWAIR